MSRSELIIGAGNNVRRRIYLQAGEMSMDDFENPVTLDIDINADPDVVWDLNDRPLPFPDDRFDEIHAYEVLEHVGKQGDWRGFFDEWDEYHRILKPGGRFFASVPSIESRWLWGDPGHTRVITIETLTFLNRKAYEDQTGSTTMTDYRHCYGGDFDLIFEKDDGRQFWFVMEKRNAEKV